MRNNFIKILTFASLLIFNICVHAVNPRDDWYMGIFIGPSATTSTSFDYGKTVTFTGPNVSVSANSGSLKYSVLGGVGGQIGYRFCKKHRIEAEFYYNNNPIKQLTLYNYSVTNTYDAAYNLTASSVTFENQSNTSNAHIQGDTNTGAFMLNFIYDFMSSSADSDGVGKVVPFFGAGIGYAYIQNAMQFYRATTVDPANDPYNNRKIFEAWQKKYIYAGQAMIGVNYFLDDFTWFAIDLRYFSTGSSIARTTYSYTSPTATETVSSNSSPFNRQTQIISANLSFSGNLNL